MLIVSEFSGFSLLVTLCSSLPPRMGQQHTSPGQSGAPPGERIPGSVSPERAIHEYPVTPFQGSRAGTAFLGRRFRGYGRVALPQADMFWPLQGNRSTSKNQTVHAK